MTNLVPNQMRYQAAPLPDAGFPRGSRLAAQPAFGTNRNRAAHCGTNSPTFADTLCSPLLANRGGWA